MYRQQLRNICREAGFPLERFGTDHFILTQPMIGELRQMSYLQQWRCLIRNEWFHLKMQDHSLFLFAEGMSPSYSFLHCPLDVMTFPEFINELGMDDSPFNRRKLLAQYELVLETASPREHVTPIRFDYDVAGYEEGTHPAAHIHVGLANSIRISSNRMSPISFVLFVMRQMYPDSWARLITRPNFSNIARSIRGLGMAIPEDYWKALDKVELYLG